MGTVHRLWEGDTVGDLQVVETGARWNGNVSKMPLWDATLMLACARARSPQHGLWPVPLWPPQCHLGFWGRTDD